MEMDLEHAKIEIARLQKENEQFRTMVTLCTETNRQLHAQIKDAPTLRAYTNEVSMFYRAVAKPLCALTRKVLEGTADASDKEQAKSMLLRFETRAKYFDEAKLVQQAHKNAAEELARLTVK